MEPTDDEKAAGGLWGWSPESRRYVLRSGSTWARLVKRGIVQDHDLETQWAASREATRQRQIAAAANARVLGLGISGGVSRSATSRERFKVAQPPIDSKGQARPLSESQAQPAPARPAASRAPGSGIRSLLSRLAVENRDALIRSDMTRDDAEQLLRRAIEAEGRVPTRRSE